MRKLSTELPSERDGLFFRAGVEYS
jgi:hypothetical protein